MTPVEALERIADLLMRARAPGPRQQAFKRAAREISRVSDSELQFLADNDRLFSKETLNEVAVVFSVESTRAAISRAAENLGTADVSRAIELLMSCKGKIVVTGVGKSGVIAQKISQTLTSTGTPAVFAIHAASTM